MMTQEDTPFYLTGGTALSRFYFDHRFSDDLDFFVNEDQKFIEYIKRIQAKLEQLCKTNNYIYDTRKIRITETFCQFFIESDKTTLKLDFVNDIETRFGNILITKENIKIDTLQNILSNKISALFRYETKDIVDIWFIAKNYYFNWEQIINETKEKELGIDPIAVADIIQTFPKDKLCEIKWTIDFDLDLIYNDLTTIVKDIISGADNSLSKTDINIANAKPTFFN